VTFVQGVPGSIKIQWSSLKKLALLTKDRKGHSAWSIASIINQLLGHWVIESQSGELKVQRSKLKGPAY